MRRSPAHRFAAVAVASILLASCSNDGDGTATTTSTPPTTAADRPAPAASLGVAVVNQGDPAADAWTYGHYQGSQAIVDELGEDQVIVAYANGVQPGERARAEIQRLIEGGARLVFVTTPSLAADAAAVAADHPEVRFAVVAGAELTDNVATYRTADEQPVFLSGMAAAGTSEQGRIGYVGTVPTPDAIRLLDAFVLGARRVDPEVEVHVRWMGTFWDPILEAQLARDLVADGADVLATGTLSPVVGIEAAGAGLPWVGYGTDWSSDHPEGWLTGAYPDWAPYYRAQAAAALDGTWAAEAHVGTLASGEAVLAAPSALVPEDVVAQIEQAEAQLRSGELGVFTGPIRDVDGAVRIEEGATSPADSPPAIDWYVEGIVVDDAPAG